MTSPSLTDLRWNWTRSLAALGVIFAAQFLLIFFLSARKHPPSFSLSEPFALKIVTPPWTDTQFAQMFLANDPSVFAVPGRHGFSGNAWLKEPAYHYETRNMFEQKESPYWLNLDASHLGNSLQRFVRTNDVPTISRVEESTPKVQTRVVFPDDTGRTNSFLHVEGELASRPLASVPELTPQFSTNLLGPTVIQSIVDQRGFVVSARLLVKSGSDEADRSALAAARQFQFAPDKRATASGNLIFDWLTLPVPVTNPAPPPK